MAVSEGVAQPGLVACEACLTSQENWRRLAMLAQKDRGRLYRFIYQRVRDPVEAEELTQQSFVEAAHGMRGFRGDADLRTWVFGIALNLISNHVRRDPARRFRFEPEDVLFDLPSLRADPLDELHGRRLLAQVALAIEDLPTEMRETVLMVLVDDLSYADAARIQEIPLGTIRSRVSRARSILRAELASCGIPLGA